MNGHEKKSRRVHVEFDLIKNRHSSRDSEEFIRHDDSGRRPRKRTPASESFLAHCH